jgi:hypothetical protein
MRFDSGQSNPVIATAMGQIAVYKGKWNGGSWFPGEGARRPTTFGRELIPTLLGEALIG